MKNLFLFVSCFIVLVLSACDSIGVKENSDEHSNTISQINLDSRINRESKFTAINTSKFTSSEMKLINEVFDADNWENASIPSSDNIYHNFKITFKYPNPNKSFDYGDLVGWVSLEGTTLEFYSKSHEKILKLSEEDSETIYTLFTEGKLLALYKR